MRGWLHTPHIVCYNGWPAPHAVTKSTRTTDLTTITAHPTLTQHTPTHPLQVWRGAGIHQGPAPPRGRHRAAEVRKGAV